MIDAEGYRYNVGIILFNQEGRLFWGRRVGTKNAWQFPQGGINDSESPEEALYRELVEEIGLGKEDVEMVASTQGWLSYRLPRRYVRYYSKPLCIGQKQKWFLLKLVSDDSRVHLDHTQKPEFDSFRWVSYWYPLRKVVSFKRNVYRQALKELAPFLRLTG